MENNKPTNWIKTDSELPPENKYVIGRYNGGNWSDSDDQRNVNVVIVKLIKGISKEDRFKMKSGEIYDPMYYGTKRSNIYSSCDEDGNNLKPYAWETFGASEFNGQDIDEWCFIPE